MSDAQRSLPFSRWWLVAGSALVIGMAGTYQFVWSSIRDPLGAQVGATGATLGTMFTVLIVAQTVAQFPAGRVRDRRGPRLPLVVGGICLVGGYAGLAVASSSATALLAIAVGGVGSGIAYTVAVNTPVKWFTERRGLATGAVSMAYGSLSFALIPGIRSGVAGTFRATLVVLAVLSGVACLAGVLVLRDPDAIRRTAADGGDEGGGDSEDASATVDGTTYTWRETIRTWQFWALYSAFVLVNGVGLMLIGKVVAFADGLGLPAAAATTAASFIALADGAGVITVSGISDRLGKTRTAGGSLVLSGVAVAGAVIVGESGVAIGFVVLVAAAAFFRSPVFAIYPTLVGEYYGTAHSSENYAALITAKLWGGVFGGTVTSVLVARLGWSRSFLIGAGLLVLAGVATAVVRPVESAG